LGEEAQIALLAGQFFNALLDDLVQTVETLSSEQILKGFVVLTLHFEGSTSYNKGLNSVGLTFD